REKNRASREENEVYFNFSEAQPVLSKSKTNLFDFAHPRRRLSYSKMVQAGLQKKDMANLPDYPRFLD
uniref:hypothetical protein n=1 Tax=Candidatus Limisoma sp. TaxID=3076476 RepID=UPI004026B43D